MINHAVAVTRGESGSEKGGFQTSRRGGGQVAEGLRTEVAPVDVEACCQGACINTLP